MTEIKCGLEIHGYIHVDNKAKLFCNCKIEENAEPNTNICPICTAMPGSKPMLPNKQAVEKIIAIGLMLGCKINKRLLFQRKHYSWPDLPSGFQRTMSGSYASPVGVKGSFLGIGITEVHIEEDPARWDPVTGKVDYNRSGLPLVEIVTDPDFKSADQARQWLKSLITMLDYIKAIDKNAGIKADTNVSVAPDFNRVEVKNINSFKSIVKAIEYETSRQSQEVSEGKKMQQHTRAFDEKKGITVFMRSKEQAEDYMFIPEPDLPAVIVEDDMIESIKAKLPERPDIKMKRLVSDYKIKKEDAFVICSDLRLAEMFEKAAKKASPENAARWVRFEVLRVLNYTKKELEDTGINAETLSDLLALVEQKKITEKTAKKLLEDLSEKHFDVRKHISDQGLEMMSGDDSIEKFCDQVISENPKVVDDFKSGKQEALNFLVGQVMRLTRGKAHPGRTKEIIQKKIKP